MWGQPPLAVRASEARQPSPPAYNAPGLDFRFEAEQSEEMQS
jgi:hypothetical protein